MYIPLGVEGVVDETANDRCFTHVLVADEDNLELLEILLIGGITDLLVLLAHG